MTQPIKDVQGQMTFPFVDDHLVECYNCSGSGCFNGGPEGLQRCDICFGSGKTEKPKEVVDCNVEDVVQKFRARSRTGYQKYGVTTERGDLTLLEWLIHLQDELMDATIYVERLKKDIHGAINQAAHKYIHELADMGFLEVPKDGSNGQG